MVQFENEMVGISDPLACQHCYSSCNHHRLGISSRIHFLYLKHQLPHHSQWIPMAQLHTTHARGIHWCDYWPAAYNFAVSSNVIAADFPET